MLRMLWDAQRGRWSVEVPHGVNAASLLSCIDFALPIQEQRYRGLPPGDVRDDCLRALTALRERKVDPIVVTPAGKASEFVAFDAYTRHIRPQILMLGA
jgi:hypothetical protein